MYVYVLAHKLSTYCVVFCCYCYIAPLRIYALKWNVGKYFPIACVQTMSVVLLRAILRYYEFDKQNNIGGKNQNKKVIHREWWICCKSFFWQKCVEEHETLGILIGVMREYFRWMNVGNLNMNSPRKFKLTLCGLMQVGQDQQWLNI